MTENPGEDKPEMKLHRHELAPNHLRTVCRDLDQFGLEHTMLETRRLLARADELRQFDTSGQRDEYADLPRRVAGGELSLDAAIRRATELAPYVVRGDEMSIALVLVENAAREVERDAVKAALTERDAALREVSRLANVAVVEAIRAGGEITDNATAESLGWEYVRGERPKLFDLDVTNLDRSLLGAWVRADEATQRFEKLRELVHRLLQSGGLSMRGPVTGTLTKPGTRDQLGMVQRCPVPLQFTVAAASGFEPALTIDGAAPIPPMAPSNDARSFSLRSLLTGKR